MPALKDPGGKIEGRSFCYETGWAARGDSDESVSVFY